MPARASLSLRAQRPGKQETNPAGQASRVLLSCRFRLRPLSRGKPPQNSRPLAGPQGKQRLTRRLFTAFHSAPLRSAPRPRATPTAPPKRKKRRHCPGARRDASLRSTALHFVKTGETGERTPASASPVLAPETLASSLASAAAWSCAGPQCQPHLWPGVLSAWPNGSPCNP